MAKHRIFTVGVDCPGDDFERVPFDSDATLLDADIILYEPTFGRARSQQQYQGQDLLSESSSHSTKARLSHWRSEIVSAVNAGKVVIVYLAKPRVGYRYTGQKQFSGTGRSRVATNLVEPISSYEAVPVLKGVSPKRGSGIRLDKEARLIAPYWAEFGAISPYQVEIEGEFSHVLLRASAGERVVGAAKMGSKGALFFLPPLYLESQEFFDTDETSGKRYWSKRALQLGKRLAATLVALATTLRRTSSATPPPSWITEPRFRLAEEAKLEASIAECVARLKAIEAEKLSLEEKAIEAGSLRGLLYEQGKPLESAIRQALGFLGFEASQVKEAESEFDVVFHSAEGRCLGEAEGKDSKPISIDKFSQLERNIQEDFAREGVTEYAKAVLFGNAYRLVPLSEREAFFTDKCLAASIRAKAALVKTPDLFAPAKYLKEHPNDLEYARQCRMAIVRTEGAVVVFPQAPSPEPPSASPDAQAGSDVARREDALKESSDQARSGEKRRSKSTKRKRSN